MNRITEIKCIWPFTRLVIHHQGNCFPCCPSWTKMGSIGSITNCDSIFEVWNISEKRSSMISFCPLAMKKEYINLPAMKSDDERLNHVIEQIMAGEVIMGNRHSSLKSQLTPKLWE